MQEVVAGGEAHWRPNRVMRMPKSKLPNMLWINSRRVGENKPQKLFALLAAQHSELLTIGDLLLRALAIEMDLGLRLLKQPKNRLLLRQRKQYQKLVDQLLSDHKTTLADYLAIIRCLKL